MSYSLEALETLKTAAHPLTGSAGGFELSDSCGQQVVRQLAELQRSPGGGTAATRRGRAVAGGARNLPDGSIAPIGVQL